MLSVNSILRRLPGRLDQEQKVFFDGIRYSAEITWHAYNRLALLLTKLAESTPKDRNEPGIFTAVIMDAWTVVDAIDRFRLLFKLLPNLEFIDGKEKDPTFNDLSQPVRNLRNVVDHLAQRAKHVVSSHYPVMGLLTWCTRISTDEMLSCCVAPGTLKRNLKGDLVNPAGQVFYFPHDHRSSLIHLAAGKHRAHLSSIVYHMKLRIKALEESLEVALQEHGLEGKKAGADFFIALRFSI